jgi:Domain of unknown function (DUF4386)
MNKAVMKEQISPRRLARIAGVFYLFEFVAGVLAAVFIPGLVGGDAATLAINIQAHQTSFWVGFAFFLLVIMDYIVVAALFYELFKVVNRRLALLATFFILVALAVQSVAGVFLLAPLVLLGGGQHVSALTGGQLQSLSYTFVKLYGQCFNIALSINAWFCILIGYLIFKSTFVPKVGGVLFAFAGLGLLTFLYPPLASSLIPYNLAVDALGELALTLWLIVMGVNAERWKEQASQGFVAQASLRT